jgi:hypothetical protein
MVGDSQEDHTYRNEFLTSGGNGRSSSVEPALEADQVPYHQLPDDRFSKYRD